MKSKLVLLALFAAPTLASAQTAPAPRVAKAPQAPMPDAQELLDNLFAPYAAAKTFSGTFDIFTKSGAETIGVSELHLKTRYRFNEKGDLQSEDSAILFVGADDSKQKSELRFIRNGATNVGIFLNKKVWWKEDELDSQPLLLSGVLPLFDTVNQAMKENGVTPVISRGVEAGRPVFILKAKGNDGFRFIVDQQTRALKSLELKDIFSIRGFDQTFDEPLNDESFAWTPPADYKRIEKSESDALLPNFLKAVDEKSDKTNSAETLPDKTMMGN